MGLRKGAILRADCGAEIVYVQPCPDDQVTAPVCACGSEFVAAADAGDAGRPQDGGADGSGQLTA